MTEGDPLWLQGGNYVGSEDRTALAALTGARHFVDLAPSTSPLVSAGGSHGVVGSGDMNVTAGSGTTVDVSLGLAFVRGTQQANQGVYITSNDATKNLSISAADSTNPRKDLIVTRVKDAEYGIAGDTGPLEVVAGTPTGGLTAGNATGRPTPPENALVLAEVFVPAGAASSASYTITDLRTRAWALGGQAMAGSAALVPTSVGAGQRLYRSDEDRPYYFNGTDWAPNGAGGLLESGYAQVTANQSGIGTGGADLTGLTATATVATARRIRITGHVRSWNSSVANSRVRFSIQEGATVLNEIIIRPTLVSESMGGGQVMAVVNPSAGSHTYKLTAGVIDTGTTTMDAAATYPAFILVEDIGPA